MTDALVIPEGYTPGPWRVTGEGAGRGQIAHDHGGNVAFACLPRRVDESREDGESWLDMCRRTDPERVAIDDEMDANAALIALAPAMAAEIDRLRAESDRLRKALTEARTAIASVEDEFAFGASAWTDEYGAPCLRPMKDALLAFIAAALSPATGETPKARRHKVEGCDTCEREGSNTFHPPHDASPRCESGGHPHCSCDTCF